MLQCVAVRCNVIRDKASRLQLQVCVAVRCTCDGKNDKRGVNSDMWQRRSQKRQHCIEKVMCRNWRQKSTVTREASKVLKEESKE